MTGRPRVCITSNTLSTGGAEMQRVLLANALAADNWRVALVVLQSTGPLEARVQPGVGVRRTRFDRSLPVTDAVLLTGVTNTEMALGLLTRVLRRRVTWIVAVHNPAGPGAPRPTRFSRTLLLAADRVVALTPEHRAALERHWGICADRVISNGVVRPAERPRAATRPATVGFLGRLSTAHKGLDRLLGAAAHPSGLDLAWQIAGSGPDEADLRRRASLDAPARVTFLGDRIAEEFLATIGVLVLLSRYEGQPMVLLEAAAAGVPVVVSAELGLADEPERGVRVVDADDAAAVVAAVQATLAAPPPERVPPPFIEETAALWAEELSRPEKRPLVARLGRSTRLAARARGAGAARA